MTRNALRAIAPGGSSAKKCTPATSASLVSTRSRPGAASAAPRRLSGRGPPGRRAARRSGRSDRLRRGGRTSGGASRSQGYLSRIPGRGSVSTRRSGRQNHRAQCDTRHRRRRGFLIRLVENPPNSDRGPKFSPREDGRRFDAFRDVRFPGEARICQTSFSRFCRLLQCPFSATAGACPRGSCSSISMASFISTRPPIQSRWSYRPEASSPTRCGLLRKRRRSSQPDDHDIIATRGDTLRYSSCRSYSLSSVIPSSTISPGRSTSSFPI